MARGLALKPRAASTGRFLIRNNPDNVVVPRILFHGYDASRGLRTAFRPTPSRRSVEGLPREVTSPSFFLSPSRALAAAFAAERSAPGGASVASVVVDVRRPLDLTVRRADLVDALRETRALDQWRDIPPRRQRWLLLDDPVFVREIRGAGYDSAVADEGDLMEMLGVTDPDAATSWAIFDPSRIRVVNPQETDGAGHRNNPNCRAPARSPRDARANRRSRR